MQYITTTDLRTKSSQLVKTLKNGSSVTLIHRSKIIGEVSPKKEVLPFTEKDIKELKRIGSELNLPKTSYKERDKIYRKHLMDKYGKNLSRH